MRAGERYWGWFEEVGRDLAAGHPGRAFDAATIDHYWSDNAPDHPVVMKTLYGLSWRAFHRCTCLGPARGLHPIPVRGRHVTIPLFARESTAFRFPAILMSGLLRGWCSGSACSSCRVRRQPPPRCWPSPSRTTSSMRRSPASTRPSPPWHLRSASHTGSLCGRRGGGICGVVFGIALGVKHNAWLMPFFLAAHYAWMRRGDWRRRRLPRLPLAFVSMAVAGPLCSSCTGRGCGITLWSARAATCGATSSTSTTISSTSG